MFMRRTYARIAVKSNAIRLCKHQLISRGGESFAAALRRTKKSARRKRRNPRPRTRFSLFDAVREGAANAAWSIMRYLLLFAPCLLALWAPLYNRVDPQLFGVPFFYWA